MSETREAVHSRTMPDAMDPITQYKVRREAERLHDEFRGIFSTETIERYIAESTDELSGSRISEFVPIFVWRFTRQRLKALAQSRGLIEKTVPEVLFVCVHNAGRSQIAAGLLARHAGDKVSVRSAGSAPGTEINAAAVQVMNELGVDMSQEFPKPLTDEFVNAADVVITMGCGDACPIYPGKRYEDWEVEDPAGRSVDEVRTIRDDLDNRVRRLFAELTAAAPKA
jgi:protein-tyrosine-phosphatase